MHRQSQSISKQSPGFAQDQKPHTAQELHRSKVGMALAGGAESALEDSVLGALHAALAVRCERA